MLRHVVMFSWADDVDDAHVTALATALDSLPTKVEVIRSFRHGPDAGINEGNFDYVLVADFDNADDYVVYRDHPDHRAFIQEFIVGRVAQRSSVQYEVA